MLRPGVVNHDAVWERDGAAKHQQRKYFNHEAHPLPELHPGDPVLVKSDGDKGLEAAG